VPGAEERTGWKEKNDENEKRIEGVNFMTGSRWVICAKFFCSTAERSKSALAARVEAVLLESTYRFLPV
jgi:hypothetical protein